MVVGGDVTAQAGSDLAQMRADTRRQGCCQNVASWLSARLNGRTRARPLSCGKPTFEPKRRLTLWLRTYHRRGAHWVKSETCWTGHRRTSPRPPASGERQSQILNAAPIRRMPVIWRPSAPLWRPLASSSQKVTTRLAPVSICAIRNADSVGNSEKA